MNLAQSGSACPCGSGAAYDACCGPLLRNESAAAGPEELMRSRYTAYAVGDLDHLYRSWHPRTRPEEITPEADVVWTGLEILSSAAEEDTGVVEFRAHWSQGGRTGVLRERSRFVRRADRWVYLDGEIG